MSSALILIAIISIIVIVGIILLFISKSEQLNDKKKATILLVVGTVIFLSFLITTFKHRNDQFTFTSLNDDRVDPKKVFFGDGCNFDRANKYSNINELDPDIEKQFYQRNYRSAYEFDQNPQKLQQLIIYKSSEDQGASYFLRHLSNKICSQNTPVVYLDLKEELVSEKQMMRLVGVPNFAYFKTAMCHFGHINIKKYNKKVEFVEEDSDKRRPYLIVDNFEYLLQAYSEPISHSELDPEKESDNQFIQRRQQSQNKQLLIQKILYDLGHQCKINMIFNTQSQKAVQKLLMAWQIVIGSNIQRSNEGVGSFPFEVHRWESLTQYDVFKLGTKMRSDGQSYLSKILEKKKKNNFDFREFSNILHQVEQKLGQGNQDIKVKSRMTSDQLKIKQSNIKDNVALYFGVRQQYNQIKSLQNRKVSSLKNKISMNDMKRLEEIKLIEIEGGQVLIR